MNLFARLWQAWLPGRKNTRELGNSGEDTALRYLREQGLELVARNFRCKFGEIDLIMRDNAQLIFVEVRWRSDGSHGGAAASVTAIKQRRLRRTAQAYLQSKYRHLPRCRFDLLAIDGVPEQGGRIQWLQDIIHDNT